jgi:hypothetical protein
MGVFSWITLIVSLISLCLRYGIPIVRSAMGIWQEVRATAQKENHRREVVIGRHADPVSLSWIRSRFLDLITPVWEAKYGTKQVPTERLLALLDDVIVFDSKHRAVVGESPDESLATMLAMAEERLNNRRSANA